MGERIQTTSLAARVAFLLGIDDGKIDGFFLPQDELCLQLIRSDEESNIIRRLCRLRTCLMDKFASIDKAIKFEMKNLDKLPEYVYVDEIKWLEEKGIKILQPNYRASSYMIDIQRLIRDHIDACKIQFGDWAKWEYIRDLFVVPKSDSDDTNRSEQQKYKAHYFDYPFHQYMHWDQPYPAGNILIADKKLLYFLYSIHGDRFEDEDKFLDADMDTKKRIHDFLEKTDKVVIAVDCENSDVYKVCSVLKGLDEEKLSKITKISLYDDANTTNGWDYLKSFVPVPVEHIEVDRIVGHKSLVDMKMTIGVTTDHLKDGVSSFILCSSDSDFWALISSVDADFIVMYEEEKCGSAIKTALTTNGTYYCCMDDFTNGEAEDLKKVVLAAELDKLLPNVLGKTPADIAQETFKNAKISPTQKEADAFISKHIKTLQLTINEEGIFEIKRK